MMTVFLLLWSVILICVNEQVSRKSYLIAIQVLGNAKGLSV